MEMARDGLEGVGTGYNRVHEMTYERTMQAACMPAAIHCWTDDRAVITTGRVALRRRSDDKGLGKFH